MFEVKQNASIRIPVRMLSAIDGIEGVTGLDGTMVAVAYARADGSTLVGSSTSLTEVATGAFTNTGTYELVMPSTASTVVGPLMVSVATLNSSARPYVGIMNVVANLASDIEATLGTPAHGSIASDIANVQPTVDFTPVLNAISNVQNGVDFLQGVETGRWKIFTTGADANRLVLYGVDGTTVLQKFSLLDSAGAPTTANPFERVPVE